MGDETTIEDGETVYSEDGEELGIVTGATTDGFTVSVNEEVEYRSETVESTTGASSETGEEIEAEEHDPGQEFGEGYIMWRCENCGEMGELDDGLPEECPSCGSDEVIKWKED